MLVLTRKKCERIVVTGPCVIEIVAVNCNSVRVGIEAAREVNIRREEIPDDREPAEALPSNQ